MKQRLNWQAFLISLLRIAIGWFFLYEGLSKIMAGSWSSAAFLAESRWFMAPVFHWMAENAILVSFIDFVNTWGMAAIGVGLILGLLTRWASAFGALLLLLYFVAYPPIPGYMTGVPTEGSYLWVNKNLIVFFILLVFIFISSDYMFGLDRLLSKWREEKARPPVPVDSGKKTGVDRREVIRNLISVPFVGAFAYALYKKKNWDNFEEKLLQVEGIDANTSSTLLTFNYSTLNDLKGQVPKGAIKYTDKSGRPASFELSRLLMGGNLIGGWTHSRDLIYVSKLVKTYHTDEKVMQTLELGEKCGCNAIISNPSHGRVFQLYRREFKSDMKFISDCGIQLDFQKGIKMSLAADFDALYCQGEITDRWTKADYDDGTGRTLDQRMELIRQGLEEIRSHGKPAGIGAHMIESIKVCVDYGLKPDFWVKTLHPLNYWSAEVDTERRSIGQQGYKDNIWCFNPEETIEFMNKLEEPWIAFKVLAAGAIHPNKGLKYAYANGADFVCMGMYDFQVVEDANYALDALAATQNRRRPWRG